MYPPSFNIFSMTSPWQNIYNQGPFTLFVAWKRYVLRPRLPADFAFENHTQGSSHSTERCGRQQNFIWLHKCILVLKCWMKEKGTTPMSFNFHDFFYLFSKTWSQFPWLFQAWKKWNSMTFLGFPWLDTPFDIF